MTVKPEQFLRHLGAMKLRGDTPILDGQRVLDCAAEISDMRETALLMLAALKQVQSEMQSGFGSSFGETREQVRRAIAAAESVRL